MSARSFSKSSKWRKAHFGIDAATLEIRAIEVTDNSIGDAPMLTDLLSQIPLEKQIASVSGDGAYDTKACHEASVLCGAHAVILTRKNVKPWKANRCGADARNEILRATRRLGRTIWEKWGGYHDEAWSKPKCAASGCLASES